MKKAAQLKSYSHYLLFVCCIFVSISFAQNPNASHGIHGYVSRHATVNFSDIIAYDAAHPELRNQSVEEEEDQFNHYDIIKRMHANDAPHSKSLQKSVHATNPVNTVLPPSPAPLQTFDGEDGNGGIVPPDVSGAVGTNTIVTPHNQSVIISDRNGVQISSVSLTAFWSSVGATISSDPKIVFDPYNGRFIFTCLDNYTGTGASLAVGVTQTDDPTGTWNLYNILVDASGINFLDFPEIGFNKNWIAISGNLFDLTSENFNGPKLFVFDKADLYNNATAQYSSFVGAGIFDTLNEMCLTPTFTSDNAINDLFCVEAYDGNTGKIRQRTISGTATNPLLSAPLDLISTYTWAAGTGGDFGTQSGSNTLIDLDDDRVTSCVYRNGHIWASHNAFLPENNPTRCSVHWFEVDTLGNFIQDGLVDDPTNANFYTYPAIAVGSNGNALLAMTNMGSGLHPSSAYAFRGANDPVNTFRAPYQYKAGQNTYSGGSPNRWGDYNFACIDPLDDSTFWAISEYSMATANRWGSWWAEINPTCLTPYTPVAILGATNLCSASLSNQYYHVTPVYGATSYTWTVTGTGWNTTGSTSDSILVTPGSGNGIITVSATNTCGTNTPQTSTVFVLNGVPAEPSVITGNTNVCEGTPQTYSVVSDSTVTGYTWTLPATWTGTSATNILNDTVGSVAGNITVTATNSCGISTANILNTILPDAPTANSPINITCGNVATLAATGNSTISWFVSDTALYSIDTGSIFITPPITYTTTYYAENGVAGAHDYSTPHDTALGVGSAESVFTATNQRYEIFNVNIACTLVSVLVYAQGTGSRTIQLLNAAGNPITQVVANIPNGMSRVTLDFALPVGVNYGLSCSGGANLYRNSTGAAYPYTDPAGMVTITGNDVSDPGRFYFFYDWELRGQTCGSARIPIVINVNNGVLSTFTYTQTGNTITFNNTSLGSTTWLWHFGDSDTSAVQSPVHTYAANGTYTVLLTASNGTCTDTVTETIIINTTGIAANAESNSLVIYPNPVNDDVLISFTTAEIGRDWTIKINNIVGQTLASKRITTVSGSNQIELNVSDLAKGLYFIELQSNTEKIVRRVVKQ